MSDWDDFIRWHRENTVQQMEKSAYVMSLVPDAKDVDVKFAVELGLAIMLDKPILAIVQPGNLVPDRLRQVADAIVVADLDTEAGKQHATQQVKEFMQRFPRPLQPGAVTVKHDGGVDHAFHLGCFRVPVVVPGVAAAQHGREPQQCASFF